MSTALPTLDRTDRRILSELSNDARLSNKELAARVHLAPSSCHARVKRLVEAGVLRGFHAEVHPPALGILLRTLVAVRLADHGEKTAQRVMAYLQTLPEVVDVFLVSGQDDLILQVAVRDTEHLRQVVFDQVGARSEVADIKSSLIYEHYRAAACPDLL